MTRKQQEKLEASLSDRQYTEYRVGMWCKPIGLVLFCFDFDTMKLYWLNNNKTSKPIKVRSNIGTDKLITIIKEYEHSYYTK